MLITHGDLFLSLIQAAAIIYYVELGVCDQYITMMSIFLRARERERERKAGSRPTGFLSGQMEERIIMG